MSGLISLYDQLQDQRKKVDFNTYDFSVKELLALVTIDNVINIAPEYQRQFRWDDIRQSSLIESLFLGLPIPSLFMATNGPDGKWELIDGVQRVSTIIHFIGTDNDQKLIGKNDKLTLKGLKKLSQFNGLIYEDLPYSIQLQLKMAVIKVVSLSDKSDRVVRFDLFERLNKGGITLSDQEIRACVFRGEFSNFIKRMAGNRDFEKSIKLTKLQQSDGTREELVLRFFAYLNNYLNFDHSVVDFLNEYMETASKEFSYESGEKIFNFVFKTLATALPGGIAKRGTTPLNLFEAVTVGAALTYKENGYINTNGIETWILTPELTKLTSAATNSKTKVRGRIEFCRERFH